MGDGGKLRTPETLAEQAKKCLIANRDSFTPQPRSAIAKKHIEEAALRSQNKTALAKIAYRPRSDACGEQLSGFDAVA